MCVLWLLLDATNLDKSIHFHWEVWRNSAHSLEYVCITILFPLQCLDFFFLIYSISVRIFKKCSYKYTFAVLLLLVALLSILPHTIILFSENSWKSVFSELHKCDLEEFSLKSKSFGKFWGTQVGV